jgi:hypothetical protein
MFMLTMEEGSDDDPGSQCEETKGDTTDSGKSVTATDSSGDTDNNAIECMAVDHKSGTDTLTTDEDESFDASHAPTSESISGSEEDGGFDCICIEVMLQAMVGQLQSQG